MENYSPQKVKFRSTVLESITQYYENVGPLKDGYFHQFAEDGTIALIEDSSTGKLERVHLNNFYEDGAEIVFTKEEYTRNIRL